MSASVERSLRVYGVAAGELPAKPVDYWRTRPVEERLRETLQLHRDGNTLFQGGNPAFTYVIRTRDVATA